MGARSSIRAARLLVALCVVGGAWACSGSATPAPEYGARELSGATDEGTGAMAEESVIVSLNRRAREAGATTDVLHGVEVSDPFRALETDSPITSEWIDVETARTAAAIAGWSNSAMAERLESLLRIGVVGAGDVAGDFAFLTRRDGDREQPALFVRELATGTERLLIDPLTYGERGALDWYFVSPRGRYIAFGISTNGDERSTLRVMETATGNLLPDAIEHTKWSEVAWLHAENGFYYRRYPLPGEPDYDAEQEDAYHPRLFFHALGTDPASDPLVFSPAEGTDFPAADVSSDDRHVVVNVFRGWSASDVHVLDRGASARGRVSAPDAAHALTPVITGVDQLFEGRVHEGRLYVMTNEGAPRYQIYSVPTSAVAPSDPAARASWDVVVPESESTIEGWQFVGPRLVLHVLDDVRSRLLVRRLDGTEDGEIELPGRGAVSGFAADAERGRLLFGFSSYVHAPSVHLWTAGNARGRGRRLETLAEVEAPLDLSTLEITQERVPSADGTPINVYLVHRRDLPRDGNAPVLLSAYGGFNISLLPSFQRHPLYWVERGGIFAVANLRGGGEFGEAWHRAGNLGNKEHVFEDMEAVIRWFSSSGWSQPSRIAITGGSNGGLLMGAMITRCPDAFGAAASYVGLYDMVRYHLFPPAELWITEYGSSEDATQFGWLSGYSPYHRVREGVHYPSVLIETADHDTRVHWGHSTKFAARLQEASGEADPAIWFYRERDVGHGAGTPVSSMVQRYVRMYAFVEHALGVSRYRP
jgi:prolyl oligopeptidase